ncbi:MAG: hypothetical protein ILO68_08330 [Clostridia bacterium]|nr:hypothetical protein [Clostridia bacterium]
MAERLLHVDGRLFWKSQAEIDLSVENDHDLFVKGFVLGAQMMLEILTADPMEDVVR